jgi:serine/threonine-protein kinase
MVRMGGQDGWMTEGPSIPATIVEPGTVIDGRYRVESLLERGSMGVVVVARHIFLDEPVAVKFLSVAKGNEEHFRARFLREARVTAKLRGRHVVRLNDFGVDEQGHPFLVMELLVGESLRAKLKRQERLDVSLVIRYGIQTCQGLADAHRRSIVHRDLKPANLFITQDVDGSDLVKIVDFGLSKLRDLTAEDLTAEGTLIGSPRYMAPEQVSSAETVDHRADIWSLGVILYEMLAGAPPFREKSTSKLILQVAEGRDIPPLREQNPDVGPELEAVILRCLTRDVSRRTPDVGRLAADLASVGGETFEPLARAVADTLERAEAGKRVRSPSVARPGEGSSASLVRYRSMIRSAKAQDEPVGVSQSKPDARSARVWVVLGVVAGLVACWLAWGVWRHRARSDTLPPSPSAQPVSPSASHEAAAVVTASSGMVDAAARSESPAEVPPVGTLSPSHTQPVRSALPASAAPAGSAPFNSRF